MMSWSWWSLNLQSYFVHSQVSMFEIDTRIQSYSVACNFFFWFFRCQFVIGIKPPRRLILRQCSKDEQCDMSSNELGECGLISVASPGVLLRSTFRNFKQSTSRYTDTPKSAGNFWGFSAVGVLPSRIHFRSHTTRYLKREQRIFWQEYSTS